MTTETLECGHGESQHSEITRGYGMDADGNRYCYACCSDRERAAMVQTGRATLYLTIDTRTDHETGHRTTWGYAVTDWHGTLRFPALYVRTGRHNMAGTRRDFEFAGPDGFRWVGVQYGENSDIAHCRRTSRPVASPASI